MAPVNSTSITPHCDLRYRCYHMTRRSSKREVGRSRCVMSIRSMIEMQQKRKKTGGRVAHFPPLKKRTVLLTEEQAKLLRMWGRGDMSAGLRWLIDQAKEVVYKPKETGDQA